MELTLGVSMPRASEEMVSLSRYGGGSIRLRRSSIEKVKRAITDNPGLTARDISMRTHVPPEHINWILECDADGQELVLQGKIARPTRGPMPRWATSVDPAVLPQAPTANALVAVAQSALAALPASITNTLALAEGEAAREALAKLLRFSGGSSPSRARRANLIIETSITHLAFHLQKAEEAADEIREALKETLDEADQKDQMLDNLRRHIKILQTQAEAHAMMDGLLQEKLAGGGKTTSGGNDSPT